MVKQTFFKKFLAINDDNEKAITMERYKDAKPEGKKIMAKAKRKKKSIVCEERYKNDTKECLLYIN